METGTEGNGDDCRARESHGNDDPPRCPRCYDDGGGCGEGASSCAHTPRSHPPHYRTGGDGDDNGVAQ